MDKACRGSGSRCLVLGVESSCDDTAAAVVAGVIDDGTTCPPGEILSSVRFDQDQLHEDYGGVVPEIAARAHAERMDRVMETALREAGCEVRDLDAVAVTAGPGLVQGLLAGVMTARGFAAGTGLPLYGINHLEAHALTIRLVEAVSFPYLLLLASGGHCIFAAVQGPGHYDVYGSTKDDAPGEAYDKVARMLGLGFPGGPVMEKIAQGGDETKFALPRPMSGRPGCMMSFSGLKTSVRLACKKFGSAGSEMREADRKDIAASFQAAMRDVFRDRAAGAMQQFRDDFPDLARPVLAVAGGVMANQVLRQALIDSGGERGFEPLFPDLSLCIDNGAMVAWAGIEKMGAGQASSFAFPVRGRWPLDDLVVG